MISVMSREKSLELLRERRLGRLGCCQDGEPYVIPVNYLFDGDCIYVHALPGRKIEMLRANPHACLQTDQIQDDYHWSSVIASGRYEEISNAKERERILGALFQRLPHLTPVESRMKQGLEEAIVFRIHVDQVTGVSEHFR